MQHLVILKGPSHAERARNFHSKGQLQLEIACRGGLRGDVECGGIVPVGIVDGDVGEGIAKRCEAVSHSGEQFVGRIGIVEEIIVGADLEIRGYGRAVGEVEARGGVGGRGQSGFECGEIAVVEPHGHEGIAAAVFLPEGAHGAVPDVEAYGDAVEQRIFHLRGAAQQCVGIFGAGHRVDKHNVALLVLAVGELAHVRAARHCRCRGRRFAGLHGRDLALRHDCGHNRQDGYKDGGEALHGVSGSSPGPAADVRK